jgi:glycosyltransferase involved in cell wall biosynthesis
MKFAAILGVKDEVEILADCIAHLRAIGVTHIIAHDAGSSDGSERILAEHAGADFEIVEHSDMHPDPDAWTALHARLARDCDADWVLFQDADEFWLPASGTLHDCRSLDDADIVIVPRFNVALGPDGPRIAGGDTPLGASDMELLVRPPENFRARLMAGEDFGWIRGVPNPKAIVRPACVGSVTDGDHDVVPPPGVTARRGVGTDLAIAHLPFSTLPRFARKIANVRRVFDVHDEYCGEHIAWHWRRWLSLPDAAAIAAEFARQQVDDAALAQLRSQGYARSLREWFAGNAADTARQHAG